MDSKMQEAPERVWVAKMFYRASERGSASLNESVRHSVPYVREDVHAAALADAQATIARLEAALMAAEQDFYQAANQWRDEDYEGPHERFTVPVVCHVKPYFDMHMKHLIDSAERARAALSPREGEG